MNKGALITFKIAEKVRYDIIHKFLSDEELEECIKKGFFKKTEDDEYIFTQAGYDFAWSKN